MMEHPRGDYQRYPADAEDCDVTGQRHYYRGYAQSQEPALKEV